MRIRNPVKNNLTSYKAFVSVLMIRENYMSAVFPFLLRKRMMEVSTNHLLLQMESNSFMLSIILERKNVSYKKMRTGPGNILTESFNVLP